MPFVGDIPELVFVIGLENSIFGAVLSTFASRSIGDVLPAVSAATISNFIVPLPVLQGILLNVYVFHPSAIEAEVTFT